MKKVKVLFVIGLLVAISFGYIKAAKAPGFLFDKILVNYKEETKEDKKKMLAGFAEKSWWGLAKKTQTKARLDKLTIILGRSPIKLGFDWETVGLKNGSNADKLIALAEHMNSPLKVLESLKTTNKDAVDKFYKATKRFAGR